MSNPRANIFDSVEELDAFMRKVNKRTLEHDLRELGYEITHCIPYDQDYDAHNSSKRIIPYPYVAPHKDAERLLVEPNLYFVSFTYNLYEIMLAAAPRLNVPDAIYFLLHNLAVYDLTGRHYSRLCMYIDYCDGLEAGFHRAFKQYLAPLTKGIKVVSAVYAKLFAGITFHADRAVLDAWLATHQRPHEKIEHLGGMYFMESDPEYPTIRYYDQQGCSWQAPNDSLDFIRNYWLKRKLNALIE